MVKREVRPHALRPSTQISMQKSGLAKACNLEIKYLIILLQNNASTKVGS